MPKGGAVVRAQLVLHEATDSVHDALPPAPTLDRRTAFALMKCKLLQYC